MFKSLKVVDCQYDVPERFRRYLFDTYEVQGNNSYIRHCPYESESDFDDWLITNGVINSEEVLLLLWW